MKQKGKKHFGKEHSDTHFPKQIKVGEEERGKIESYTISAIA